MRLKTILLSLVAIVNLTIASSATNRVTVNSLRCEYLEEPLGVDVPDPRFTWTYTGKDFSQASCQINIATTPELLKQNKADVWNSEKIQSSNSFVVFKGNKPLESHRKYYWNVSVWDTNGRLVVSPISSFEMGKLSKDDWNAQWITDEFDQNYRPSPLFRKSFNSTKNIRQARVYVSGLGYYELFMNGKKIVRNKLDPGYTHFDKRVLYTTYDVSDQIKEGKNSLAAVLGNGWFNVQSLAVWHFEKAGWRKRPQLICELQITYDDGTVETISSDESWKTSIGAYTFNNIYSGDAYDARLEEKGWTDVDFDDAHWKQAQQTKETAPLLVSQMMPPIRVTKEIKPVSVKNFGKNKAVFDFGVNMAGFCRLKIKGLAGTKITLKYGELLKKDGRLEQGNIDVYFQRDNNDAPQQKVPGEIFQMDTYILKGGEDEVFTPSFTYHGFQYVEVESSDPIVLTKDNLTALFLHTDVKPVGSFSCSNDLLNKIWKASTQSYLSNLHSIPTDCPQREKNGWLADAHISIDLGLLNYDGITFYEKWMNDFIDNQRELGNLSGIIPSAGWGYETWIGPVWDAALFIIPNALYNYYGDSRCIEKLYATCERYLSYLKTKEVEGSLNYGLGDWVPYKTKTPTDYTSTCFYYQDQVLMARFAALLGKDAAPYQLKAASLKELINKKYFKADSASYANGSQTALATALYLNLVPKEYEQRVADKLHESIKANGYHLDFGMLGSKFVPAMLTKYGYVEDAYKMVAQETEPSWGAWIQKGMTTLPETWILDENFKDASLNHVFLGDVSAWMCNSLAGINYDELQPGFRHVLIRPHFIKDLQWIKGEYRSVNGIIRSEWKREGKKVVLTVTIPANTSATIYAEKPIEVTGGTHRFTLYSNQTKD